MVPGAGVVLSSVGTSESSARLPRSSAGNPDLNAGSRKPSAIPDHPDAGSPDICTSAAAASAGFQISSARFFAASRKADRHVEALTLPAHDPGAEDSFSHAHFLVALSPVRSKLGPVTHGTVHKPKHGKLRRWHPVRVWGTIRTNTTTTENIYEQITSRPQRRAHRAQSH